jgi:hypothetical protein
VVGPTTYKGKWETVRDQKALRDAAAEESLATSGPTKRGAQSTETAGEATKKHKGPDKEKESKPKLTLEEAAARRIEKFLATKVLRQGDLVKTHNACLKAGVQVPWHALLLHGALVIIGVDPGSESEGERGKERERREREGERGREERERGRERERGESLVREEEFSVLSVCLCVTPLLTVPLRPHLSAGARSMTCSIHIVFLGNQTVSPSAPSALSALLDAYLRLRLRRCLCLAPLCLPPSLTFKCPSLSSIGQDHQDPGEQYQLLVPVCDI